VSGQERQTRWPEIDSPAAQPQQQKKKIGIVITRPNANILGTCEIMKPPRDFARIMLHEKPATGLPKNVKTAAAVGESANTDIIESSAGLSITHQNTSQFVLRRSGTGGCGLGSGGMEESGFILKFRRAHNL
jgi:hypothetical protein